MRLSLHKQGGSTTCGLAIELRGLAARVTRREGPGFTRSLAAAGAGCGYDKLRTCLTDAVPGCCTRGVSLARWPCITRRTRPVHRSPEDGRKCISIRSPHHRDTVSIRSPLGGIVLSEHGQLLAPFRGDYEAIRHGGGPC